MDIVWVDYGSIQIRGFAGVDAVYINKNHFLQTKQCYKGTIEKAKLDLLLTVDVINVVVQEYAIIKLRMVINLKLLCLA